MSKNVNFSAKQARFIQWLANPSANRTPNTQADLASELGVAEKTLVLWKSLPGFRKAVQEAIEELAGDDDAEIIEALKDSAKTKGREGSADRKLYLQWRGWLVEKKAVEHTGNADAESIINRIVQGTTGKQEASSPGETKSE